MPKTPTRALLIFIKNPEKGKVKTRLAATLGNEQALAIYKTLLQYTRDVSLRVNAQRMLWYSESVKRNDDWSSDAFTKKEQQGETLGQRMKQAFRHAFDGGFTKAVIIGSDCAQLKPEHINRAYEALATHEVVIGPSQDGGYYLLGMRRFLPDLFDDKSWSTTHVFDETCNECRRRRYSFHLLEELNDVDTEADWEQVKANFE